MSTKRAALIVALFAAVSLLVIPVYPHFLSPNEFTRWAFAAAVVEHHTTELSQVAPMLGSRFEDLAMIDGRVYSNKAPGAAVLGTIGYLVARPFTTSIRPLLTTMRLVAATLPVRDGERRTITAEGVDFLPDSSAISAGHAISPDGRFVVAFDSDRKPWLYPTDGGEPRALSGLCAGEMPINWTIDGRSLDGR